MKKLVSLAVVMLISMTAFSQVVEKVKDVQAPKCSEMKISETSFNVKVDLPKEEKQEVVAEEQKQEEKTSKDNNQYKFEGKIKDLKTEDNSVMIVKDIKLDMKKED